MNRPARAVPSVARPWGASWVGSDTLSPLEPSFGFKRMVGTGRFELPTPRTPSECSTRLSHVPTGRIPLIACAGFHARPQRRGSCSFYTRVRLADASLIVSGDKQILRSAKGADLWMTTDVGHSGYCLRSRSVALLQVPPIRAKAHL